MLDCSIHLSSVFLFFQSLALVILLLSLTEGYIHLGSTVIIDKDEGWNNGETRLLAVLFKTAQFALGEKKLAVAARDVYKRQDPCPPAECGSCR